MPTVQRPGTAFRKVLQSLILKVGVAVLGAWFLVKPVRALVPTWVGMHCAQDGICVEADDGLATAHNLYAEAFAFIAARIGPLQQKPRLIFCATDACADTFGLGKRSAVTLGTWATVIGPRAWKPYYVRHEMIHVLQAQELGVVQLLLKPQWFKEGMAYGLSEDPRQPLAEPFESQRAQFFTWYRAAAPDQLWIRAAGL